MVRWLERNGYDVSYFTGVDSDRRGSEILDHKTFLSVGHDEYWSAGQRANVEAARDAGVNLAFFSGNESLLEDPLGAASTDRARTTARWSATRRPTPAPRSTRARSGPAPGATRARSTPRAPTPKRADGHDLHGQPRHLRDQGAGGRRQAAPLAEHQHRLAGPGPDAQPGRRHPRATSRTRTLDNGSRPPGSLHLLDHAKRRPGPPGLRLHLRLWHGHPPPDPVPRPDRER